MKRSAMLLLVALGLSASISCASTAQRQLVLFCDGEPAAWADIEDGRAPYIINPTACVNPHLEVREVPR